MEISEMRIVEDSLMNIAKELNDDILGNVEFFSNQLKESLDDIPVGMEACANIGNLNSEAKKLKEDTIAMYNSIVELMRRVIMEYNQ